MQGYDYIVVGAGSSGAVIAARLSEEPNCRVLLIEAGGKDNSTFLRKPGMIMIMHTVEQISRKYDWGYRQQPKPQTLNRDMGYYRGKVLGGCSSVNRMVYVRGNRKNYDDWAAEGNEGWSYDDVLPYFKKLETYHDRTDGDQYRGSDGPLNVTLTPNPSPITLLWNEGVAEAFDTVVNPDYNGESQEGASTLQVNSYKGLRQSTSVGYLDPIVGKRPNLEVLLTGMVTRVILEGTTCVGVEVSDRKGKLQEIRCEKEVILSAGTTNSPTILLHSGIGPKEHLAEVGIDCVVDLPVGENLQDHAFLPLTFNTPLSNNRSTAGYILKGILQEYLGKGGSFMQKSMFENVAFVNSGMNMNPGAPDMQLHAMPWAYPAPNQDAPGIPEVDKRPSLTILPTIIYPKSRGTVRLKSNNPLDKPHIDPNFFGHEDDKMFFLNGIERIRDMMGSDFMKDKHTGEIEPGPEFFERAKMLAEIPNRVSTVYHPVGTCRMGVDDYAVVDPQLRVRGIQNLRVADCSIMPSITGGNTNIPAVMIGERASDLIRN